MSEGHFIELDPPPPVACPGCGAELVKHDLIEGGGANTYACGTYQWASSVPNAGGIYGGCLQSRACEAEGLRTGYVSPFPLYKT